MAGGALRDAVGEAFAHVVDEKVIEQAHLARQAFHDFGKGRHATGAEFRRCFAYAFAKLTGEPRDYRFPAVAPARRALS